MRSTQTLLIIDNSHDLGMDLRMDQNFRRYLVDHRKGQFREQADELRKLGIGVSIVAVDELVQKNCPIARADP